MISKLILCCLLALGCLIPAATWSFPDNGSDTVSMPAGKSGATVFVKPGQDSVTVEWEDKDGLKHITVVDPGEANAVTLSLLREH